MTSQAISQAIDAHNAARTAAPGGDRPALTWSADLAAHAQEWVNHLAEIDKLQHADDIDEGENIFASSASVVTFTDAVNAWVSERANYNGEKIGETPAGVAVGHYTQVVWPDTTQVGMAMAKGATYTYIVGRYSPQGNWEGETAWRAASS
ncbi:CAP domain-containing protein [Apodospora peruviana]|uniref:CAP domain-containing protein n=1 Tax=Apodospora peruviana TaxID=516989 RepID=A0AAE0HSN5_9PEZI|nr:CAP domain-containing protein [Apodospora peruviana]